MDGLRERKKAQTRREIHAAALHLASQGPLSDFTVDDIAAQAGVSARTVFNYFPTKESALVGMSPELADDLAADLLARPESEPIIDALEAVVSHWLLALAEDTELWKIRHRLFRDNPEYGGMMASSGGRVERALIDATAQRLGADADADPRPTVLVGAVSAAARWTLRRVRLVDAESVHELLAEALAPLR